MTLGESFNPRYEACGFHPEEVVARRRDLTDGQKWLYDRMVRWARAINGGRQNERAGEVWRSHENMADELGKSPRQISRDMARLEAVHLISHRTRDGRKSNTYYFLFHASFEQTSTSGQTVEAVGIEETPVTGQIGNWIPDSLAVTGRPRPVTFDLTGHPRHTNQEIPNQQFESSSSMEGASRQTVSDDRSTTSVLVEVNSERPARGWTAAQVMEARQEMQQHFGSPLLPDLPLTREILAHMESPEDVRLWLLSLSSRRVKPQGWGLYRTDSATWPARRPDVAAQVLAARITREQREAEEAARYAELEIEEARRVEPLASPLSERRCVDCQGTGIRQWVHDSMLWDWCVCAAGGRVRMEKPNAVDQANAQVIALRQRFPPSAEHAAEVRPIQRAVSSAGGRKGLMRASDLMPQGLAAAAKM